jgi:soluble lytic murein transglycosylase-like protein
MAGVTRVLAFAVLAAAVLSATVSAGAETYKFVAPDGTVHFTNAPSDPQYRRMPGSSGSATAEGAFRVPATASSPSLNDMIRGAAQRHGVSEQLISAVIRIESGYNARAVSRKGARGLMQLMPGTAAILGVRDSFDPVENIDGGVRHLRGLLDRFGNDLPLVLAAYNAGEGAVNTYRGIPPYAETQSYVERILSILGGAVSATLTIPAYRYVSDDGAVVYTNIPPRGIRARR